MITQKMFFKGGLPCHGSPLRRVQNAAWLAETCPSKLVNYSFIFFIFSQSWCHNHEEHWSFVIQGVSRLSLFKTSHISKSFGQGENYVWNCEYRNRAFSQPTLFSALCVEPYVPVVLRLCTPNTSPGKDQLSIKINFREQTTNHYRVPQSFSMITFPLQNP